MNRRRLYGSLGLLRPPPGKGKVIWVQSGADEDSVHRGVELVRAIRDRRRDVRIVLTFDREYPKALRGLAGLEKVAVGWGPTRPGAVKRAFRRLSPAGIISAAPKPLPPGARAIAFHIPPGEGNYEAAYPWDEASQEAWRHSRKAAYVAPGAQVSTLLIPAQVEPVLRHLVGCEIFWLHGLGPDVAAWEASPLARLGVLLTSGVEVPFPKISRWERDPLPPGNCLFIDDARWFPAVAAASSGSHILDKGSLAFWQALAGGAPVDTGDLPFEEVLARWQAYRASPHRARRLGDEGRKAFWEERRRAAHQVEDLLQRVWIW